MKHLILIGALLLPNLAAANCYADYKARHLNGGLNLHYGVVALANPACENAKRAERAIAARLADHGWELLRVMSIFDESELEQKADDAGDFFLKF